MAIVSIVPNRRPRGQLPGQGGLHRIRRILAPVYSVALDLRLVETLGRAVIDPRAEIFVGETEALISVLAEEQEGRPFPARVLAQAAVEVAARGEDGTRAGRVALLRSVASFLLHDRCSRMAVVRRLGE
jgi:hypothetical protein